MTADKRIPHTEAVQPQTARIRIRVNGEDRRLAARTALATFLTTQDVPAQFVAVAVNNEVVRRADHPRVILQDGDVVEIVRMVGGGCGRQDKTRSAPATAHIDPGRGAHQEDPYPCRQKAQGQCP